MFLEKILPQTLPNLQSSHEKTSQQNYFILKQQIKSGARKWTHAQNVIQITASHGIPVTSVKTVETNLEPTTSRRIHGNVMMKMIAKIRSRQTQVELFSR